jgi:hypothetical protein
MKLLKHKEHVPKTYMGMSKCKPELEQINKVRVNKKMCITNTKTNLADKNKFV